MSDIFDNGNAAVFDFASIAAYVNRKPQPVPVFVGKESHQIGCFTDKRKVSALAKIVADEIEAGKAYAMAGELRPTSFIQKLYDETFGGPDAKLG